MVLIQQILTNRRSVGFFIEIYQAIFYYYYSFYLQSDAVPLQVHTDSACYYKENPPVPIQRQKPRKYIGKIPCLRLTLGKGKPISYYLLQQLSVQGFAYLYFINISARYNTIKVPVVSILLYIHFLAPFCPLCTI